MNWKALAAIWLFPLSCSAADSALPKGKLVFQTNRDGNEEIYLRDENGVETNLTNNPSDDAFPSISRDGKRVVFTSTRDGIESLYIMNIDGTNLAPLVSNPGGPVTYGHFSGDGKLIVFTEPYSQTRNNIFLFDRATWQVSGPIGIPNERCEWGHLTPDGLTLVVNNYRRPGGPLPRGWYVTLVDRATGTQTVVDSGCEPAFSADGTKLLYVHLPRGSGNSTIRMYDMATGQNQRMTAVKGYPYCPRFTRNGKWIIFAMTPDKKKPNLWELYIMSSTPLSPPIRITSNNDEDVNPDFR